MSLKDESKNKPAGHFHAQKISKIRLLLEILFVFVIILKVWVKRMLSVSMPGFRGRKLDFRDKVVLLTGAGGGFGRRIAERLAAKGAIIACVDIDKSAADRCVDAANEAAKAAGFARSKPSAYSFRANLAKIQEIKQLVKDVEQQLRRVDILISGAVCYTTYDVLGFADDEIDFLVDLNFKSTVWLTRAVLPGMKSRGFGQIVTLSSLAGSAAVANLSMYCACKSALKGFMNSLHEELRKDPSTSNIGVTVLSPFFTATSPIIREMTTSRIPDLDPDSTTDKIVSAIEYREVHCVIPAFMASVAGIYGLLPQEAVDYIIDLCGASVMGALLPKATVPMDEWTPVYTPTGSLVVAHDHDSSKAHSVDK